MLKCVSKNPSPGRRSLGQINSPKASTTPPHTHTAPTRRFTTPINILKLQEAQSLKESSFNSLRPKLTGVGNLSSHANTETNSSSREHTIKCYRKLTSSPVGETPLLNHQPWSWVADQVLCSVLSTIPPYSL